MGDPHGLCRGAKGGSWERGEIPVFESVGASLEDLAAALVVGE